MSEDSEILDELGSLLVKQLELTRAGNLGELDDLMDRTEELSPLLPEIAARSDEHRKSQLERITDLHRQLGLALAGKKQELRGALRRLHGGQGALHAYRGGRGVRG
jgi:hypothetical protein